jgi:benzaldehyde dehydrogenase (NAD)
MGAPETFADRHCRVRDAFDNGSWKTPRGGSRRVVEPATGAEFAISGVANAQDMQEAITRAHAAQAAWAATGPRERAAVLLRAAQILEAHFDELAMAIARETGGIVPKGQHEVKEAIVLCQIAAGLPMQAQGHVLPSTRGACRSPCRTAWWRTRRQFRSPGYPQQGTGAGAGHAAVPGLTPTAGSGGDWRRVKRRQFDGVFRCCPAMPAARRYDPRVPMIAFTGSPAVGRRIGALAGEHLKKVSLELGGANNLIVLEDADLDAAASAAAFGAWFHQGQICMASNRILVHESIAEGFKARMVGKATHLPVGDGASGQVALGPMIDAKQLAHFDSVIKDSVKQGAVLEAGGTYEGLCYKPTVLSGVKPGIRSFDEEPFGPVVNLITFSTDDEAVQLANTSQGGLAAAVISPSIGRALAIGQRLRAGMVHINDQTVCDECTNPFGGPGIGGNGGSVGGPADIDEYTQWQWITVKDAPPPFPF